MKNCKICLLLLGLLCVSALSAQRSEIGIQLGGSFYMGDLNPKKLFSQTQFSGGLLYRYNIDTRWAFRSTFTYGKLVGDDKKFDNPRNLNFRTNIFDFSVGIEVNFLNFFTGGKEYKFTPYLMGGIALFFSNPQSYYFDSTVGGKTVWVDLRSLHTEGQGMLEYPDVKNYSAAHIAIPFGIGFKYSVSKNISIGLEWTMRYTFTDYVDDVSGVYADKGLLNAEYGPLSGYFSDRSGLNYPAGMQRGNANGNDWYSFINFNLNIKLGKQTNNCPAYSTSATERLRKR